MHKVMRLTKVLETTDLAVMIVGHLIIFLKFLYKLNFLIYSF